MVDSEGVSATNLEILAELAVFVLSLVGPWIISADWNLTPEVLASTGWLHLVKGCIKAPLLHTCNQAVYDFFVLSQSAQLLFHSVCRVSDSGLTPHWPTRILLRGDVRRTRVRCLAKPMHVPGALPDGPVRECDDFDCIATGALSVGDLQLQSTKWLQLATRQWEQLVGKLAKEPGKVQASFVWQPAAGPVALRDVGATMYSQAWRTVAKKFNEVCSMLQNRWATRVSDSVLKNIGPVIFSHILKTRRMIKFLSKHKNLHSSLSCWLSAVVPLIGAGRLEQLSKMCRIANLKANAFEAQTARLRKAKWKVVVGTSTGHIS